jgi:glycosyltransferase involved in cell wall biosynthesis
MRIGIETGLTGGSRHETGIGVYASALIEHLKRAEGGHSVFVWGKRQENPDARIPFENARLGRFRKAAYLGWQNTAFLPQVRRNQVDVVHFTNFLAPFRKACPYVTTVHDLHSFTMKEFGAAYQRYRMLVVSVSVRNSDRIIVGSDFVRREVERFYPKAAPKVVVIYHGVDRVSGGSAPDREAAAERVRQSLHVDGPFLLAPGPMRLRKNHVTVIAAFAQLKDEGHLPHKLIITGEHAWAYEQLHSQVISAGLEHEVLFPGHIAKSLVQDLTVAADCLLYLSLHEGFGLPCVEAMAAGVPVVAANCTALPEVVGDAGILVAPEDVRAAAAAVRALLSNPEKWRHFAAVGRERSRQFTWERSAAEHIKVYESVQRRLPV